jgi:hypothetical protein
MRSLLRACHSLLSSSSRLPSSCYHFDLAKKHKSLSAKEIDFIKFLVTQVALLSLSLMMEEACEVVIAEPHVLSSLACEVVELQSDIVSSFATPTSVVDLSVAIVAEPHALSSMACEVVELQSDIVSSSATPSTVVDVPVAVVGSPSPLAEALELQAIGVMVSFTAKPPNIAPLEVGPKGAALMCSLRSTRLAAKSRGGTLKPLVPYRRLPSKVVSWWHSAHPRPCSLCSGHRLIATAPSSHVGFLRSAWCKEVEVLRGRFGFVVRPLGFVPCGMLLSHVSCLFFCFLFYV